MQQTIHKADKSTGRLWTLDFPKMGGNGLRWRPGAVVQCFLFPLRKRDYCISPQPHHLCSSAPFSGLYSSRNHGAEAGEPLGRQALCSCVCLQLCLCFYGVPFQSVNPIFIDPIFGPTILQNFFLFFFFLLSISCLVLDSVANEVKPGRYTPLSPTILANHLSCALSVLSGQAEGSLAGAAA